MASTDYEVVELPFEVVKNSGGFAMDIGGTVVKIAYRDKEDWDFDKDEPKMIGSGLAHVRTVIFDREERKELITYIREHCHLRQAHGEVLTIYTTGIGGHEYGSEFETELNIRLKNLTELDCFVKAFRYLSNNMSEYRFLHPVPAWAAENFGRIVGDTQKFMQTVKNVHLTASQNFDIFKQSKEEQIQVASRPKVKVCRHDHRPYGRKEIIYPCILASFGAEVLYMKLDADGTFTTVDCSGRGARFFYGLGSILTGAKSISALLDLAQNGSSVNVHTYGRDLHFTRCDEISNKFPPDRVVHCFAKGFGRDIGDFREEDLARSLLHTVCLDLAHITHLVLKTYGVRTAYCCGGFGHLSLVREFFTEEFLFRTLIRGEVGHREARFVKNGCHLGAIGAFLGDYKV